MNNTRVLPARLHGVKLETGGHVEFLLLKNTQDDCWEVLAKPAKRLKVGATVSFGDGRLTATVEEELEHGGRIVRFHYQGIFLEVLESLGEMPLPPYIHEKLADRERYQTPKKMVLQQLQRQVFISPKNCSKRLKQKGFTWSI